MVVAHFSYGIPPIENPAATVAGAVLGALAFISIGVLLGSLLPTPRSAQGLGMLVFFPSFLLGGGGPPPDAMGPAMRTLSTWTPLTHVIRADPGALARPRHSHQPPDGHRGSAGGIDHRMDRRQHAETRT